mmetsp:Transcript_20806/g.29088  ORF Transcript_20806/g.29088 Transcript_20806/m.29088 type:complete len:80 (+) Transcript_20806:27-266(+)
MNLAGFCRNCLAKWLYAGKLVYGGARKLGNSEETAGSSYNGCLKEVYGMEYSQWKKKFQAKASQEQVSHTYKHTYMHTA